MIALEAVSKHYSPHRPPVVDQLSLRVARGELLVLLGGSGSGKTTTLKMINRLVEPSGGRVLLDGRDVAAADPVALRRSIGYVFQGIGLFPHLSVAENIAVVPKLLGWPAARIAARADELLALVRLPPDEYRGRMPRELSGGQQQRVGFARALAAGQQVLLLDEPFGALDPLTRDELRGDFHPAQQLGLTAVLVTHDMTEALLSADRIAVLKAGRLVRIGTPRELLAEPGDDFVAALLTSPRRQMQQLETLLGGGGMTEHLGDLFAELPANLGGHMLLCVAALAVGMGFSLPLGVLVSRRPRLSEWVLGVAGVLQTIPSLALLALMVPLLGGIIGFWPAFVAMTLYSLLPILANTVVGLRGVDPVLLEAAAGLGMSERQALFRVRLPLAAPVILGGVRTATVLVVGSATLATPVGEKTLGNYIFEGLNTRDHLMVVFGCVLAALLAVAFDQLVRLLEVASRRRSVRLFWLGAIGLVVLVGGGLLGPSARALRPPADPAVVVGTHDYTEQYVLAEVLRDRLTAAGYAVDQRKGMAQKVTLESLCLGGLDCSVDYTGNLWATVMKRTDTPGRDETLRAVADFLHAEYRVECLGPLGFENAYALAMRRADAERLGVVTLADLRRHAGRMRIGGDLQFFRLGEWERVESRYGLAFAETVPMDPTLMYQAVDNDQVQVICAYTSDGRVDAYDLVILKDPLQAFPPYDAILSLSEKAAKRPALREALMPLVGAIDLARMRAANRRVDVERLWPRKAGRELLDVLRSDARERP